MAKDRLLNFDLLFTHFEHKIKPIRTVAFLSLTANFYQSLLDEGTIAELLRLGLQGGFVSECHETMAKNSKNTRRFGLFLREGDPTGY